MEIVEDRDIEVDALQTELDSALNKLVQVLACGKSPDEAAWWLCANHAKFIIGHPNLVSEGAMIEMAKRAGTPPRGESWQGWFDRVRNLKPSDVLRRRETQRRHQVMESYFWAILHFPQ